MAVVRLLSCTRDTAMNARSVTAETDQEEEMEVVGHSRSERLVKAPGNIVEDVSPGHLHHLPAVTENGTESIPHQQRLGDPVGRLCRGGVIDAGMPELPYTAIGHSAAMEPAGADHLVPCVNYQAGRCRSPPDNHTVRWSAALWPDTRLGRCPGPWPDTRLGRCPGLMPNPQCTGVRYHNAGSWYYRPDSVRDNTRQAEVSPGPNSFVGMSLSADSSLSRTPNTCMYRSSACVDETLHTQTFPVSFVLQKLRPARGASC